MYQSRRVAARARRVNAIIFWQPDPNTVHADDTVAPNGPDTHRLQPAPSVMTVADAVAAVGIDGLELAHVGGAKTP